MRFEETLGVSHLLRVTEHELRQNLDHALADLDLTYPQYAALSGLEVQASISNADLARNCFVTAQTMNKIIENLVAGGLVRRSKDPENAVKQCLSLSPNGKSRVCKAHIVVNKIERAFIKDISYAKFKGMMEQSLRNLRNYNSEME